MNKTANYQLNQWDAEDKVQRIDFNADNAKIDAALKAQADALAAERSARESGQQSVSAELAKKGNCGIDLRSYCGTGTFGPDSPTVIRFPRHPAVFFVAGPATFAIFRGGLETGQVIYDTKVSDVDVSWSGFTASITTNNGLANWQLNARNQTYRVITLYDVG